MPWCISKPQTDVAHPEPLSLLQGGGSVQMAYAMSQQDAKKAPDGYISDLSGGGEQYHVYVHR